MINIKERIYETLEIKGGCNLRGTIEVSGAKNSALPNMAAVLLTDDTVELRNVPYLLDVNTMINLLQYIGLDVYEVGSGVFRFKLKKLNSLEAPYELVSKMRASILVLGPLLARFGYAQVALPGGCSIGTRPVDLHLEAFRKMGADIKVEHGYIIGKVNGRLKGSIIEFPRKTVTGTENVLMASVLADGVTVIKNAALEPEVVDLANMLKKMGAIIEGEGTDTIKVTGVESLKGVVHEIIPDRIEAGTFAVLSALFEGNIVVKNYPFEYLTYVHKVFEKIGFNIVKIGKDQVVVVKSDKLNPVDIETREYPYFPTDLQAQIMTLLTVIRGNSSITENIFENRFMHVPELQRLGAEIKIKGKTAYIKGVERLTGAEVKATDLRASAAMLIAGLIAEGNTVIHDIYHLDRGYENIDSKLKLLGAEISRA
ncbi:UDP-N-acetylglucosamine 1-carboxyvinyltransferase [Persephonella sp.]